MAATDTRNLTGPRWSSAVTCTRRATYDGLGADKEPPPERIERIWRRGQIVGEAIAREIIDELGADCEPEKEVPWPAADPIGTGHMDIHVPSESLAVEVVSNAGCPLPERKAIQVAGYALNAGCDKAMVVSVDPSTGERRDYPIDIEGLEPAVRAIEAEVVEAVRTGVLPERTCKHPHDGPAMFCPYARQCFADWQRPDVDSLIGGEDIALRLAEATDEYGRLTAELHRAKEYRDALRDELRPYVPVGETVAAGPVDVKRTVSTRRTLSLSSAEKAGHRLPTVLEEFVSVSESERWTIKRRGV